MSYSTAADFNGPTAKGIPFKNKKVIFAHLKVSLDARYPLPKKCGLPMAMAGSALGPLCENLATPHGTNYEQSAKRKQARQSPGADDQSLLGV